MTQLTSSRRSSTSKSHIHSYSRSPSNASTFQAASPRDTTPSLSPSPTMGTSTFAKPFDRFQTRGGGACGDIFRRFKIRKSEEEQFIMHWVRQPRSPGFLTRDERGILVFRISSSEISDLSSLGIGLGESPLEWVHFYDEQGISWLSRCSLDDCLSNPDPFQSLARVEWEHMSNTDRGIFGRHGPSGFTPAEFYSLKGAEGKVKVENGHCSVSESD